MKILIVSQRYWPESFRITDIAEALVKKGHNVTVLTGLPMYPKGFLFDGYKNGENRIQEHNGVKIIRSNEIERKNGIVHRFMNYYSFPFYANKLIRKIKDDFNVVLINELSPIMCAIPGFKYAKKHGLKTIMYEMDLWPESLLAGGIKKDSLIYKYYKRVSSKLYSKADKILVSTKDHINYIKSLDKCGNLDIEYLPQYADSIFEESNIVNIDNKVIDIMFAGNVGKAQDLVTVLKAAQILNNDSSYQFHIVGDGSELDNLKKMAESLNLKNVKFYGQKQLNEMPNLYNIADVMLVTLEDKPYANMTIPGKTQSYMAVGKPIICVANGAASNFVMENNLGYAVKSGDSQSLTDLIKTFEINELRKIGLHARDVYFKEYSKNNFMDVLLKTLKEY